ncbi:MAG: hypothetical protein QOG45_2089 [Chloroflexota bacterium]|nr:hypothetical protein [Chloroflexota bacterium]
MQAILWEPQLPLGDPLPVERLILALRSDFGCLVIALVFVVIMVSTIVFADIVTPPAANPFV